MSHAFMTPVSSWFLLQNTERSPELIPHAFLRQESPTFCNFSMQKSVGALFLATSSAFADICGSHQTQSFE
jgi:hypothetical protein